MSEIDSMISRLTERQSHEFAVACARRVQRLMRDPRSIAVLDTRERWLRGEATNEEMAAAEAAAWDAEAAAWDAAYAAWAAARAAARDAEAASDAAWSAADAAWAAARAAARAVARAVARAAEAASDAAWSAAAAASDAAWDAAWDAERAWQRNELERMLAEGGGA